MQVFFERAELWAHTFPVADIASVICFKILYIDTEVVEVGQLAEGAANVADAVAVAVAEGHGPDLVARLLRFTTTVMHTYSLYQHQDSHIVKSLL